MTKMKVVWICHFSNAEVQKHLPLVKLRPQFGPWITLLIEEFEKIKEIELYVISPFEWLKYDTKFKRNGVQYYFLRTGIPFIHRHWPAIFKFDYWTNFFSTRRKIKNIVNEINPDIINLHGIENPYYSTAIFDLKKYPLLITVQGLFSFSKHIEKSYMNQVRLKTEQRIIHNFDNFGIRVKFLSDYIKSKNPKANFFWFKYPFLRKNDLIEKSQIKTFDIVFFAKLSKDKGIEDLIRAIQIVKQQNDLINVKVIGAANEDYLNYLKMLVSELGLGNNIEFLGFIEKRDDLHNYVSKAKICVLPTYNDILPGTIIESLFLKVPVIAYAANGVVDFNSEDEIIRLVELGNINELANQINILLADEHARERMSNKAMQYAIRNFNNEIETTKIIESYRRVISAFKNNS